MQPFRHSTSASHTAPAHLVKVAVAQQGAVEQGGHGIRLAGQGARLDHLAALDHGNSQLQGQKAGGTGMVDGRAVGRCQPGRSPAAQARKHRAWPAMRGAPSREGLFINLRDAAWLGIGAAAMGPRARGHAGPAGVQPGPPARLGARQLGVGGLDLGRQQGGQSGGLQGGGLGTLHAGPADGGQAAAGRGAAGCH